ncbi:MerR family DNA-binding transcriptional regulator [Erysipelatoclostridium sp. An173]
MYTTYTIGELAKILGVTAETIRYYERKYKCYY